MRRLGILTVVMAATSWCVADEEIDFNRQVRPILSDKCYACHGADSGSRKPSSEPLRLDERDHAIAPRDAGAAIVPGAASESLLMKRILSRDPDEVMPPSESHMTLSHSEKQTLRKWIDSGAPYAAHWAFIPPQEPDIPTVKDSHGVVNPIDSFVRETLESLEMAPSPEAEKRELLRRLSFTLTGLSPTTALADSFLKDDSAEAVPNLIDRLLESESYGERMAQFWLDAARYADTDGYQNDGERSMWPWRDWVIKAFNDNMPYDQFTIEQLAGDLLPAATQSQVLASAFNRNHRLNDEGGALPEEFIVEYRIDRVDTVSTIWLGLTAGCARCHDHKYDPLSQKEYFQLYDYFARIEEKGKSNGKSAPPMIRVASPLRRVPGEKAKRLDLAREKLQRAEQGLQRRLPEGVEALARRVVRQGGVDWEYATPARAKIAGAGELRRLDDGVLQIQQPVIQDSLVYEVDYSVKAKRLHAIGLEVISDSSFGNPTRFSPSENGNFVLTNMEVEILRHDGSREVVEFARAESSFSQSGYPIANAIDSKSETGWAVRGIDSPRAESFFYTVRSIDLKPNDTIRVRLYHESEFPRHSIGKFRLFFSSLSDPPNHFASAAASSMVDSFRKPDAKRTAEESIALSDYFIRTDPKLAMLRDRVRMIREETGGKKVPVMIMRESSDPQPTYLLRRGQYDEPDTSEVLVGQLPKAFVSKDGEHPNDRLELARWLVSSENPLGARVAVNRIWQQHFGVGLVKTAEDFGNQGEWPSHPALLDWLAVTFMKSGWDVKALHRLILSSATYRQSSRGSSESYATDPENRLLSRGPRFRLDAMAICDQALQVSGLLTNTLGGPPVKPYQPPGLWESVNQNEGFRYLPSSGADLYRRSLYTYWKRAVNPPRSTIFDSATREVCSVNARRTNTPLQALVLMNDVTFLEAARALAARMIAEGGDDKSQRLAFGFHLVTGRLIEASKASLLKEALADFEKDFSEDVESAREFLAVGEMPRDETIPEIQHAAYMALAHLLLNLDETITLE